MFLKSKGHDVDGNSGLKRIAWELSLHLGEPTPETRPQQWKLVADFMGKPESYEAARAKQLERRQTIGGDRKQKGSASGFLQSQEWVQLRYAVLRERGAQCECCGATRSDGVVIQVDHIKPRSLFPELALQKSNLQVLCRPCNLGKSNRDDTDWRDGATLQ